MILIFLIILIIIIIGYLHLKYSRDVSKELSILPSSKHLINIIDNSNYFERLNKLDLIARHVHQTSYREMYKKSIKNITNNELKTINNLIDSLNDKYLFKYSKLSKIPWYIVKFEDIELNYPHTLGDIIFLPQKFFNNPNIKTLLHEKIHIYQRTYPIETSKIISLLGFKVYDTQQSIPDIRSNPDTDSFIYMHNNTVQTQIYNSDNPSDISDSKIKIIKGDKLSHQYDHPFEVMAYMVTDFILNNKDHNILKHI